MGKPFWLYFFSSTSSDRQCQAFLFSEGFYTVLPFYITFSYNLQPVRQFWRLSIAGFSLS